MKAMKHSITCVAVVAAVLVALVIARATPAEAPEQQAQVDKARITFDTFIADANMDWIRTNLKDAKGILIVPAFIKGAFVVGGAGGSGVLLARDEKTDRWTEPAFYTMGTASFGLQIGGQSSEVILMVMTRKALESLYTSSVKLGGDFSVAAGPVGVGAATKGVAADMISFARSKGAFMGFSLDGAVVKVSGKSNDAYYGKQVRPVDILVTRAVSNPKSAELRQALARATTKSYEEASAKGLAQFVYARVTCNIRSGPGTNYSVIRTAAKGERLEYLSLEGDWYKLEVARGKPQEWVARSVVTLSE
jgi:lipid-binding SYLF domain-containing protein